MNNNLIVTSPLITGQRTVTAEHLAKIIMARAIVAGMRYGVDPYEIRKAWAWTIYDCKDDQELINLADGNKDIVL